MANTTIPQLPAVAAVTGDAQIAAVQNGITVRITAQQIANISPQTSLLTLPNAIALDGTEYVPGLQGGSGFDPWANVKITSKQFANYTVSNSYISSLPAATSLTGTEKLSGVQVSTSSSITAKQIADYSISNISSLTAASSLTGTEKIGALQSSSAVSVTTQQIANLAASNVTSGSYVYGPADYDLFIPFSPSLFSISGITTGGVMTVTVCDNTTSPPNVIKQGMLLYGAGIPVGTIVVNQYTGSTGNTGTYQVSPNPGSAIGAVSTVFGDTFQIGSGVLSYNPPTVTFTRNADVDTLSYGGTYVNGIYYGNYSISLTTNVAAFEFDPDVVRWKYKSTGLITGNLVGGSGTANRQLTAAAGWTLTNCAGVVNATGVDGDRKSVV